jgi:RND superfamily putative drug exporter
MIFERIANVITKHYKMVIIIWVIALLISVPAMLRINDAISYNATMSSGDDYESLRAQDLITDHFQRSVANGTLMVLLQADDVTNTSSRDFVLALQQRIMTSSDLMYLEGVSSVYTYSEMVMDQAIMQIGPTIRPAEQQVNMSVNMSSFLLWGIPALHVANWNTYHDDPDTFNATNAQLTAILAQRSDLNITKLAFGYYSSFASTWNATAGDPLYSDPIFRADHCVETVAPSFISLLPVEQQQIMIGVLGGFDISNFADPFKIKDFSHAFTLSMIGNMASITNMTFLQQVYDLGPTYQQEKISIYVHSIVTNGTLATYPIALPEQLVVNFLSPNNRTMLFLVTFSVRSDFTETNGVKPLPDDVKILRNELVELKADTGSNMDTYVTGDAAISQDMRASSDNDMKMIEPVTIVIILVLMGILFRTLLGQFLPLGAVGVVIGISQALVYVIGTTIAQVDTTVMTMLFAVLMGVGTDYSIFIISRYREERMRGATREQAVHVSVTWAGESIVTSGATVIVAFFAMALSSFSFVQTMGLIIGLSIIVALLVALTLVPAFLMLVGNRIFWPTTGKRWGNFVKTTMQRKSEGNHGYFHRAATFSVDHARVIIIAAILVSIPTSYIYMTQESSFDFIGSMGNPESIQGMNAMTSDFGAGRIMPTQIVITGDTVVYDGTNFNMTYLNAIENVTAVVAVDSNVQKVTGITRPYGELVDYRNLSSMPVEQRQQLVTGMIQSLGNDSKIVLLTVILKEQPEKASSVKFIPILRNELSDAKAREPALSGSVIMVGGATAQTYDLSLSTSQQFNNIEIIVVVGIFIVLMIVLGSILLPVFAILSIAMSISWAFALTSLVFGTWLGLPILWLIPLILFVMLMGIGMDYNVFILTRIREEVHKGKDTRTALIDAVDWTGGIITALALIMAGAFGSIMLSSNSMLQEFGFALSVAVLLDAMVVRTYIVPAALMLMGDKAWWAPGRLQREGRQEKMDKKERDQDDRTP